MQAGTLLHDDERMFKLPCPCCIETEIGLQRNVHLNPLGHVDERAARPDRTVQCSKFMCLRRHKRHKVPLNNIAVLLECRLHIRVDDPLLYERLLNRVIDHLGVVLCSDACERGLLRLGNPQTVKRILDVLGNLIPVADHLRIRTDIGHDLIHVQRRQIRPPRWHRCFMVDLE